MKKAILVTGNQNKVQEYEDILSFKIKNIKLNLKEIQAIHVKKVIEHKTKLAFEKVGEPVICEDTGLYFNAWNGLPGALIKWFGETIGYNNLCGLLKENREARAQTIIGYFDGKNYEYFIGEIFGRIALEPKGKTNFGWDNIFIPNNFNQTFAEMGLKQKNAISMRSIALKKLRAFLFI